jgi:hypothetical protein
MGTLSSELLKWLEKPRGLTYADFDTTASFLPGIVDEFIDRCQQNWASVSRAFTKLRVVAMV